MLLATVQVVEDAERRSFDRKIVGRITTLRSANSRPVDIVVRDFSADGFRFSGAGRFSVGNMIRVGLGAAGTADARIVRRAGDDYGCSFVVPLTPQRMAEAFSPAQVIEMRSPLVHIEDFPEQPIQKWPGAARVSMLIGAPVLLWSALAGIAVAFWR